MSSIVAMLCLLLVALGSFGRFDARLDAINFALPYIVIVGLMACLWVWRSAQLRGLLLAATILAASAPLLIDELPNRSHTGCHGPGMRLVQYNAFKDNDQPHAAARWLIATRADVIVLEEASRLAPLLARAYPYRQDCTGSGRCSTFIMSRIRPFASGGAAHGDPENRAGLSAAWMRLRAPDGRDVTIVGVHLGRPWPFHRFTRDRDELRGLSARLDRERTIVAGDFNLPGWTYQMHRLETDLGLYRAARGFRTWPAKVGDFRWPLQLLNIDHILTGPAWHQRAVSVGPAIGSDHRPVSAELVPCDTRRHVAGEL